MTKREQAVCDLLYDERSRQVFAHLCAQDSPNAQICEPCAALDEVLSRPYIVYGAGEAGKLLLDYAQVFHHYSNCIAVWDKGVAGKTVRGITVEYPADEADVLQANVIVAVKSRDVCAEIKKFLDTLGIQSVFFVTDYFEQQHTQQFFCNDIFSVDDGEVFVDGGVADFSTSLLLLRYAKKKGFHVKKIYALEPDRYSFSQVKRIVKENRLDSLVYLENAALWSEEGDVTFAETNQSAFGTSKVSDSGVAVKARKLDHIIAPNERITYIKLDVEGSEYEVLRGAEMVIKRDKPKLAIAIGHKPDDHLELTEYVHSLLPEYRLYIRHYSVLDWEPVLYAIR